MSSPSSEPTVLPVKHTGYKPSSLAAYAHIVRKHNIDSPLIFAYKGSVFIDTRVEHQPQTQSQADLVDSDSIKKHRGLPLSSEIPYVPPAGVHEVPANILGSGAAYVVPVTIGTPGVTLNLDFDTASGDLWVLSNELDSKVTAGHTVYNPSKSSTAVKDLHSYWATSYADETSADGSIYIDTIKIGDLTVSNQAVGVAEDLDGDLGKGRDGLLGLGWPVLNSVGPTPVATPVENIIKQKLASGIFSVALNQGDSHGFYTFGGIDAARAGVKESDITYNNLVNKEQGFWQVQSETTIINGEKITNKGNIATIDTGASLLLVSEAITNKIYGAIPGAKLLTGANTPGWVYPTTSNDKVPDVAFAVGDKTYRVNASNFAYASYGKDMFYGGIQSRGHRGYDVFGDVFLKNVYVVFDQEKARLGVAQRTGNVPGV